jgi:DHA3 family tetracycline resistance protein-like MFS transporter
MSKKPALPVWYFFASATALLNATAFAVTGIYYVNEVGLNPLELILLGTAMESAAFLFEIPTGVIADVYSRRASVIVGVFISGLAITLIGAYPNFYSVVAGAFLYGFAYTFISGAIDAWLADEIGPENLGPAYFRAAQLGYAGSLLGIGIGVGLATLDLALPIVVAGLATIGHSALLALWMPEDGFQKVQPPDDEDEDVGSWRTMAKTLADGVQQVRGRPVLMVLLAIAGFMGMYSEGVDRLSEAHLLANFEFPTLGDLQPVVWLGALRAFALLLGIVGTTIAKRVVDPSNARQASTALFAITVIEIVGTIGFALSGEFLLAIAWFWFAGMARSSAGPIYRTWLNQNLDSRSRATVISMSSQMDALGQIGGGPAVGAIGNAYSLRAALVTSGLVLSPALWLYARVRR